MESNARRAYFMDLVHLSVTDSYPLELLYVKALFLQKHHRRCVSTCRELLEETFQPAQRTFIQFYLALAHDELARTIHNYSQAKIPAFSQAEQLYREALQSLPAPEQCEDIARPAHADSDDPFIEQELISRYPSSTTLGVNDNPRASLYARSPGLSPHIRNDSLPTNADAMVSPGTSASDFDDLESHESYNQIMTPTRLPKLERDYSSFSLFPSQAQQMSQGLMRPIRVGEPPRQYHVPPRMPYAGGSYTPSKLPRLQPSSRSLSPVPHQMRTHCEQVPSPAASSVPPVSPLGSESVASDASTISSLPPDTPIGGAEMEDRHDLPTVQRTSEQLSEHLEGMRIQLERHIELVQEAKRQTINIQAERAAARQARTSEGRLTALMDATANHKRIQQSHSFWSFTPQDVKAMENQKRVEAGRARGWKRDRFDPTRYIQLAETALAEL